MSITPLTSPSLSSALGSETLDDTFYLENALAQKQSEFVDRKVDMDEQYASREQSIDKQTNKWIDVLGDVGIARTKAEGAVEEADKISSYLLEMRAAVEGAANNTESTNFKDTFNEKVRQTNVAASTYGEYDNLIGGVDRITREPNTLSYVDDFGATETKLTGTDLSADFRITSEDGTVWTPDLGASTLEQYEGITNDVLGAKTKISTSTTTGLTLVSYDETSGAITLTARIDGEDQTISGKLDRYGTKLMSSWFYNDFENEEGIKRAYADINSAENITAIGRAQSTLNLSITESSEASIRKKTDALKEDKTENLEKQTEAQLKLKEEYELQYNAMAENIEMMKSQQASYLNIFGNSLSGDSKSLVDLLG
ncbi:MAG: hypothetical protein GY804_08285 [Alphaproteobacteria bacterium]|nr:hypothetical protein [Alphaproteobacteria bacterium]